MSKKQNWLIISHAFNMDGRAASHTITDKIPHLQANQINPIIISAKTGHKDNKVEHFQLLPFSPACLRFDLRHILSQRWGKDWRYRTVTTATSLLLAPFIVIEKLIWPLESQWSWWVSAYIKGKQLIRQRDIDVIYSTGGAYAAHVAGFHLAKKTGVKWIAEIHDPLVNPDQIIAANSSKQDKMRAKVEEMISHADIPFWFTEQAKASAEKRHPRLKHNAKVLIPGADQPTINLPAYQPSQNMILAHFGSLSPTRHLADLIECLTTFKQKYSQSTIELHIYGATPDSKTAHAIQHYAQSTHVNVVGRLEYDPISGKSGREQILAAMRSTDVLVLQHGTEAMCAEYIPSKVYEYLWMQRPILGMVYRNPQLKTILTDLDHTAIEADNQQQLFAAIETYYQQWENDGLADLPNDSPYTTKNAVRQLINWLEETPKTIKDDQ